jgi:hypothetical protein
MLSKVTYLKQEQKETSRKDINQLHSRWEENEALSISKILIFSPVFERFYESLQRFSFDIYETIPDKTA